MLPVYTEAREGRDDSWGIKELPGWLVIIQYFHQVCSECEAWWNIKKWLRCPWYVWVPSQLCRQSFLKGRSWVAHPITTTGSNRRSDGVGGGRKPYKQTTAIPGRWWQVIIELHYPIHCVFCTNQAQSRGGDWENLMEEVRFELSLSGWIRQAPCRVCQRWSLFVDNSDKRLTFT